MWSFQMIALSLLLLLLYLKFRFLKSFERVDSLLRSLPTDRHRHEYLPDLLSADLKMNIAAATDNMQVLH